MFLKSLDFRNTYAIAKAEANRRKNFIGMRTYNLMNLDLKRH
ncbi:hypothetical protein WL555_01545 [Staphylococcus warneri]|nr:MULTISPECIES: hypothetical protein [Staphylococcus]MCR1796155.1 hypothetical protein [Staphylococcus warneri]MCR4500757.1 hypothetical protein [Staphylococcus warneri]MDC6376921.1 hypothetical protein [Staphylococcus warneri]MDH8805594.1 hypothetical protein [Staphylococcus warneri]MDH8807786.1 hypothetical protein [Staphylococcus warneri]